jgi:hypothetical protein
MHNDSGRGVHVDLNASATTETIEISDRERLESLVYHNRKKQPCAQADILMIHFEWLAELALEAIDARENG